MGSENKNKICTFNNLAYEFLGSCLVSMAYNLNKETNSGMRNYILTLFIVSIWGWKVSSAHFNFAITTGSLFMIPQSIDNKDWKDKFGHYFTTVLA